MHHRWGATIAHGVCACSANGCPQQLANAVFQQTAANDAAYFASFCPIDHRAGMTGAIRQIVTQASSLSLSA